MLVNIVIFFVYRRGDKRDFRESAEKKTSGNYGEFPEEICATGWWHSLLTKKLRGLLYLLGRNERSCFSLRRSTVCLSYYIVAVWAKENSSRLRNNRRTRHQRYAVWCNRKALRQTLGEVNYFLLSKEKKRDWHCCFLCVWCQLRLRLSHSFFKFPPQNSPMTIMTL